MTLTYIINAWPKTEKLSELYFLMYQTSCMISIVESHCMESVHVDRVHAMRVKSGVLPLKIAPIPTEMLLDLTHQISLVVQKTALANPVYHQRILFRIPLPFMSGDPNQLKIFSTTTCGQQLSLFFEFDRCIKQVCLYKCIYIYIYIYINMYTRTEPYM